MPKITIGPPIQQDNNSQPPLSHPKTRDFKGTPLPTGPQITPDHTVKKPWSLLDRIWNRRSVSLRDEKGRSFRLPSASPTNNDNDKQNRNNNNNQFDNADGEGEPRRIYFNLPLPAYKLNEDGSIKAQFARNKIRTAKYTPLSFIPKNLVLQFQNVANVYFLFVIILNVCSKGPFQGP